MSKDTLSINYTEPQKVKSKCLRDTWSEWLNRYDWEWWCTFTFRDNVTAKTANRKWYKWLRMAENELADSPGYFRVTEMQTGRQVLHFHALMLNVKRLRRLTYMDHWDHLAGFARIYPYQKDKGANHYLTKYISKSLSDYRMGGCILRT